MFTYIPECTGPTALVLRLRLAIYARKVIEVLNIRKSSSLEKHFYHKGAQAICIFVIGKWTRAPNLQEEYIYSECSCFIPPDAPAPWPGEGDPPGPEGPPLFGWLIITSARKSKISVASSTWRISSYVSSSKSVQDTMNLEKHPMQFQVYVSFNARVLEKQERVQ